MELALSIALGIILAPIIGAALFFLFVGSASAGVATSESTDNPLFGFIVGAGIFAFVIFLVVSCVN